MAQTALYAYTALLLRKKTSTKKWFFVSFILGSMLPDLDFALVQIAFNFISIEKSFELFHKTFSHSVFVILIIYLLFLIIYEITKNKKYLTIGNGIFLGMIFHVLIDIPLSFYSIQLFWPLPTDSFDLWSNIKVSRWVIMLALSLEFFFFRLLAWEMIKILLSTSSANGKYLKFLTIYMKIELLFLIIFSIVSYFIINNNIYYIYSLFYVPSLITILYFIFLLRKDFDTCLSRKDREKEVYHSIKTPIKNIQ